jgi:D-alanyl-D-alanine carboxypeptidase
MLFSILATIFFLSASPLYEEAITWNNLIEAPGPEINSSYSLGPKLSARSALVMDFDSGKILFEKNSEKILPIASISKLMTALVFLEKNQKDWDEVIQVSEQDLIKVTNKGGGEEMQPALLNVLIGDELTLRDIFNSGLVRSANNASKILARTVVCCGQNFADLMNEKAQELGMRDTYFLEPTGLSSSNRSSARDLTKLVRAAFQHREIREALSQITYDLELKRNGRVLHQRVYNTDQLLGNFIKIEGAKTGYLDASGYCFAGVSNYAGQKLIVVVLGADSNKSRFQEAKSLIWWVTQQKKEASNS